MENESSEFTPAIRPLSRQLPDRAGEPWQRFSNENASDSSSDRSLQHYLAIAQKRRRLIGAISATIIGAVTFYSFLATRLYTATANLKIGSYSPALKNDGVEDLMRAQTLEQDYLNTQVDQLSSLTLADKVLSDPEVGAEIMRYLTRGKKVEPEGNSNGPAARDDSYLHPLNLLKRYQAMINVEPVFKTSLVKVSATTADRFLSARVANAHSKAFIDLNREERQRSTVDNLVFLRAQASELEAKVAQSERNMAVYAEEHSIITLESNESLVVKQMAELNRLLTEATGKRIKSEAEFNEAKSGSGLSSTSLDDESIRTIRTSLKESEAEYAMLSQKFQPSYPRMIQLRARIDELKGNLKRERQSALNALEAMYKSDVSSEEQMKEQMERLKDSAFDLSRKQVQYNIMKREYESLKDLYQNVLRQLKEAQMSAQNRSTNIVVSDLAAVPDAPSRPRRKVNILLALGFGPIVGFMVAMLLETLETGVSDAEDVHEVLGLPSLGVVPVFNEKTKGLTSSRRKNTLELAYTAPKDPDNSKVPGSGLGLLPAEAGAKTLLPDRFVTISSPRSVAAEAFQTIRTSLLLSSAEHPPQVVVVTSAKKHEGKTTLVSNLGVTLAQASSRTVLVDCDLRRPSLHKRFNLDPDAPGLVDYLTGARTLEEVMVPTAVHNLFVLPSGASPPNPAALIGSRKMTELLKLLSAQCEFVLLDSPPILPVADALMLSSMGAGVILVVHSKQTHKRQVQEATRRLRQARAGILGVVVNQSNVRERDYYDVYGEVESFELSSDDTRAARA